MGTLMYQAAKENDVSKVIHTSTSEVYELLNMFQLMKTILYRASHLIQQVK